jgi:hydrogenase expression/formation protein HypE
MEKGQSFNLNCPLPNTNPETVLLAHGGGGTLMHRLIETVFMPRFANSWLDSRHDGAVIRVGKERFAFTTDSYVVKPIFFPGGDIGKLAVHGTVNDLAMCGARPLFLSAGFILEEGLPMETLERVTDSMREAASEAGVKFVTGDTKVVDRGKADGLFINTAGIGLVETELSISPQAIRPGDGILLNGDIGRHGMAIMSVREGLSFESPIQSDSASLAGLVLVLLASGVEIHCLRDATRGGLASVLVEIAQASRQSVLVDEAKIPVMEEVRGACEILGLDPLYVANEGRFVAFIAKKDINKAQEIMQKHPMGVGTRLIGQVTEEGKGLVTLKSGIGAARILDMLSGEQLPRIC